MSVQELESAVARLSRPELAAFYQWMEEFVAEQWDQQIEEDVRSGRLDPLLKKVDAEIDAGHFKPL